MESGTADNILITHKLSNTSLLHLPVSAALSAMETGI